MKRARALASVARTTGSSIGAQNSASNELVQILPDGTTRPFLLDPAADLNLKHVVPIQGERTLIGFIGCGQIYSTADPSNPLRCSVALLNNPDYSLSCLLGCDTEGEQILDAFGGLSKNAAKVTQDGSIIFATRAHRGLWQGYLYRHKDGITSLYYQASTSLSPHGVVQVADDTFALMSRETYQEATESRRVIVLQGNTVLREITLNKWAYDLHRLSSDTLGYKLLYTSNSENRIYRLNWRTGEVETSVWLGNSFQNSGTVPIQNDMLSICDRTDINDREYCFGKMTRVHEAGPSRKVLFNHSYSGMMSVWDVTNTIHPIKKFSLPSAVSSDFVKTKDGFFVASGALDETKIIHFLDSDFQSLRSIPVPDSDKLFALELVANQKSNIVWMLGIEGQSIVQTPRLFMFNADTGNISEVQTSRPRDIVAVD